MKELILCLKGNEEIEVENKLRELYTLQDKPIKKDQFATMLAEIIGSGKPFGAIMAGLNDLKTEDLRKLSYPIIMNAIFNHCEKVDTAPEPCDHCSRSGFVIMKDDDGRNFSLACTCPSGNSKANQGNVRWNGYSMQTSRARTLTRWKSNA